MFPTGLDFLTNLPPNLSIPEDNIWEVFVTVVRYKAVVIFLMFENSQKLKFNIFRSAMKVCCRIIGSKYTEMYDNLISDMDLHYFDKTKTPGRQLC